MLLSIYMITKYVDPLRLHQTKIGEEKVEKGELSVSEKVQRMIRMGRDRILCSETAVSGAKDVTSMFYETSTKDARKSEEYESRGNEKCLRVVWLKRSRQNRKM